MKILKTLTLQWWETSLFKLSMIALGILVGATWPDLLAPWRGVLLAVFALPAAYLTWVWWKQ
jgi:hypothetical protein